MPMSQPNRETSKPWKYNPPSGEAMTPPAWCPLVRVWILWTPWEWLTSTICHAHWPPGTAGAKPHSSLPSHPCSLSSDLQALFGQASSKRTCLNVSPSKPLEALLWLPLLAPGPQLLTDKLLRWHPALARSPAPLLENRLALIFTRCVHFTLSEIRSTEIFYPTYVTINGTY